LLGIVSISSGIITNVASGRIDIGTVYYIASGRVEVVGGGGGTGVVVVSSGVVDVKTVYYIASGNINVANFPTTYDVSDRSNRLLGIITNVGSGRVDIANWPATYDISDRSSRLLGIVSISSGIITNVASGTVDTKIIGSTIMIPTDIQAQYYSSIVAISTGFVAPNQTITSNTIVIDRFRTKTISGWSNFNGNLKIYVAPVSGIFHPYPYYSSNITSGTTFSFSFTEAFAEMKVSITNTSTTTGNACVYVSLGVL
jgi:hypothetical protein